MTSFPINMHGLRSLRSLFTVVHVNKLIVVNFILVSHIVAASRTDGHGNSTISVKSDVPHKESRGKMRDSLDEIKILVESLQRQVTSLKKAQTRDRSQIRSLENRLAVTSGNYKTMENNVQLVMEKIDQSKKTVRRIEQLQKEQEETISELQFDRGSLQQQLDDVQLFQQDLNQTVFMLGSDVGECFEQGRQLTDTLTTVTHETAVLRAQQLKQKTNLKHMKLELSGFIEEFLPDDDGDETFDELVSLNDKQSSRKVQNSDNVSVNQATVPSENISSLSSDNMATEGSGNIEKMPIHEVSNSAENTHLKSNNRHNEKRLKKDVKMLKEVVSNKELDIERLQGKVLNLSLEMAKLENKVLAVHKDGEIMKTQQAAANLTQYLMTIDQWRVASPAIINATQENQEQMDVLADLILNNTNRLGKLEVKLIDHKYLTAHAEQSFESEIHRLNESLKKMKHRWHHHSHAMSEEMSDQFDQLFMRFSQFESRIMAMEVKVLNTSLLTCAKQHSDFSQDIKLKELGKKLDKMQENILVHRETLTRMDRGLYRLHTDIKSHKDLLGNLKKESKKMNSYIPEFKSVQVEVKKFLHHLPRDCADVFAMGQRESGDYIIHPEGSPKSVRVYCDMLENVGWTVIQRRQDGSEHFSRPWADYKEGFGNVHKEFWLGNDYIHLLTKQRNCSLLIEMYDTFGHKWIAEYDVFRMNDEDNKYSLFVDGYHGNATDSLGDSNGMAFSTEDRDQDASSTHCALYYTAGWWYKHCHYCNLNGRYNVGIVWFNQEVNEWLQMNKTVLKIISH